jgi:hypothetical protein
MIAEDEEGSACDVTLLYYCNNSLEAKMKAKKASVIWLVSRLRVEPICWKCFVHTSPRAPENILGYFGKLSGGMSQFKATKRFLSYRNPLRNLCVCFF